MARFCGIVGYSETVESSPGVWTEKIVEKKQVGDVLSNARRWERGENLNDNLNLNNSISIIADSFAYQNAYAIKYVKWAGASWSVTNVEIKRPRLILTIGGVYNGEESTGTSEDI